MSKLTEEQQAPLPSSGDVWLLVLKDMEERRQLGIRKYGVPVQPGNGRDALTDAYQEALDLCVYLRQVIAEREVNVFVWHFSTVALGPPRGAEVWCEDDSWVEHGGRTPVPERVTCKVCRQRMMESGL